MQVPDNNCSKYLCTVNGSIVVILGKGVSSMLKTLV